MVDAHVHFWDPRRLDYPWLAELPALNRPFLPSDLDTAGTPVDGLVVVQGDCRWEQADAETGWLLDLARADPRIHGVVAAVPLERGEACGVTVAALAAEPLAVGVRRLIQDEPPGFAVSRRVVAGTRLLAGTGLVSDLCVRAGQLREVTRLAQLCPDVPFVLDHLGKPPVVTGAFRPWADDVARLAALPNVVCKLSGLTTEAAPDPEPRRVLPYLRHALDCFSPSRCVFGGDWPVASLTVSYAGWYDLVAQALADLSADERAGVLGANARRVYGLARARPAR